MVTADKLLRTESIEDIAAANNATNASPNIPVGSCSIKYTGNAKL